MKLVVDIRQIEVIIKKSSFIGIIIPCATEHDALRHLSGLHARYPDASHIVYAYRIQSPDGLICRFHDAGEPGGTAGKPIFQHLEGKQLINLMLVVVRYFGGVKLGAGGLSRAYGNVAKQIIDQSTLIDYVKYAETQLTLAYNQLQTLEYHLKKLDGSIVKQQFSDHIHCTIRIPEQNLDQLLQTIQ